MDKYWEARTTPAEERRLARYIARVDDPAFDLLRGVLGYLSIGRSKQACPATGFRLYSLAAAAAAIVLTLAIGLSLRSIGSGRDRCIRYTYGEQNTDHGQIMASVESSLADFFAGDTPAETNLIEMFQR